MSPVNRAVSDSEFSARHPFIRKSFHLFIWAAKDCPGSHMNTPAPVTGTVKTFKVRCCNTATKIIIFVLYVVPLYEYANISSFISKVITANKATTVSNDKSLSSISLVVFLNKSFIPVDRAEISIWTDNKIRHVVLPGTPEHLNITEHSGTTEKPGTLPKNPEHSQENPEHPRKTKNSPKKTRNTPKKARNTPRKRGTLPRKPGTPQEDPEHPQENQEHPQKCPEHPVKTPEISKSSWRANMLPRAWASLSYRHWLHIK